MSSQLEAWSSLHETAVLLFVGGRHKKDIAQALGRSEEWVQEVLTDSRAMVACEEIERRIVEQVASRGAEVQMKLRALAGEALDELVDLLKMSDNEAMRFKAATAILDRAGFTAVQRSIHVGAQIPVEVADRIEQTLSEMTEIEAEYRFVPAGQRAVDA